MIDRKLFQKTFSTLHASPDTLSEVYWAVHEEEHKQPLHRRHAISKGVLIAAVLAMCITVAGAAGVSIAGLIKANVTPSASITAADLHAFSADSMDSETPVVLDNSGNVLSLPKMERVSTDAKTMWRLVGDYLSTVDAAMEVDGYTIQLNTFLIDENGTGFLTYTLSNPNGVTFDDNGYGEVYPRLRRGCISATPPAIALWTPRPIWTPLPAPIQRCIWCCISVTSAIGTRGTT